MLVMLHAAGSACVFGEGGGGWGGGGGVDVGGGGGCGSECLRGAVSITNRWGVNCAPVRNTES